jgi:hypothetical protein
LEGSGHDVIKALYWNLPGGTEEKHNKTSVKIASIQAEIQTEHLYKGLAGVPDEIQTQHFPNTSDKNYQNGSHDQPIHTTLQHCHLPSAAILTTEKSQQLSAKLALVIQTGRMHRALLIFYLT